MKHAIIVAHPNQASFNQSVARTYKTALAAAGHEVLVRDLYEIGFDPRLQADELPGAKPLVLHEDVKRERNLLADVNAFAFVYPLWLNSPPAIFKGYLERVFGMGFAYGPNGGGTGPLLEGRSVVIFSSSGAPTQWVKSTGAWDALQRLFDEHLAAVCGFTVLEHVHSGNVVPGMRPDAVERLLANVRAVVAKHF
ncbi:MAG TPA: NAD(P)H-dependent oxidoreductase [Rhizomicrobium sp.]|nr:NAD(P)H-dependent oxidoreductase [Rhizomicrobium sp.]